MKSVLPVLVAVLAFSAMATSSASAWHPLFLTASGKELSFTGEGSNPVLRAEQLGVVGTMSCEKVLISGRVLPKSPLAHRIHLALHGKCMWTLNGTLTTCTEPILPKLSLGEIGLLVGNKKVLLKLEPDDGTGTFWTITCGSNNTTLKGAVIGEFPEINRKGVNQYNKLLTESELVFESVGKNSVKQLHTEIELLGVIMTKEELKTEGFFGGPAAEEGVWIIKPDGGVEICTKEPQNCP